MIERILQKQIKKSLQSHKSILLLGPRQVGKSTLVKSLNPELEFNLSQQSLFLEFARDPNYLESVLSGKKIKSGFIFIDEVQRIPSLLHTIQYLIDSKKNYQFVLTGSSARKLKRGKANLLPGRVHSYELGPLTALELTKEINLNELLQYGLLPGVYTESINRNKKILLKSYATTYLSEEIKAEALTKNIEGFSRFLFRIAVDSTSFLDLSKISSTIAVPRQTTQRYFEILEDTLIVKRIEAFAKSEKKRIIQHPRFYFFDNGVLNSLLRNYLVSEDRKEFLFENFIINQILITLSYTDHEYRLSTYRTDSGSEVDAILELNHQVFAIEIKSGYIRKSELGGLNSFARFYGKNINKIVISSNLDRRTIDDIEIYPWIDFLKLIFNG